MRPKGGRPPLDDRKVLEGLVYVLRSGIPWASLPNAMGCGSGMTCCRRLRGWQAAGVFERLPPRAAGPPRLGERGRLKPLLARQRLLRGQRVAKGRPEIAA